MNVFGRVANVAGSLAGVAKNVIGETQAWDDESEVEALLSRISDAYLAEDRREAMVQLKELLIDNTEAQLAVGNIGLPVLSSVCRDDRDDLELVRGALEALTYTFSAAATPANRAEVHPGMVNAELFARHAENVQLLLSMLEEEPVGINDFYVRYYAVQLLTALLNASSNRLQEAILSSPLGVVRLMDMLAEREVIRNEALLLLVALTRSNVEIQKIAAFEGAFDHIFNIVREEGGADGAIIVQDSVELLNNLLRGNLANQRLFREMGFVSKLNNLLAPTSSESFLMDPLDQAAAILPPNMQSNGGHNTMPRQKAANLLVALETVLLLSSAPTSNSEEQCAAQQANRSANQAKLVQAGVMDSLIALTLKDGGVASGVVRSQALRALGEMVAELSSSQEKLGAAVVGAKEFELPALQACLQVALGSKDPRERAAATHVIRCFCLSNPDGQSILVSTVAPMEVRYDPKHNTFGGELVRALLGRGEADPSIALLLSCRAASILQFLLEGNAQSKQRVLTIMLEIPTSSATPVEYLMPRCMKCIHEALKQGPKGRVATLLLLRLFIVWLKDCPMAVATFVNYPWHLPFLSDIVASRVCGPDPDITGLAALLLGLCLAHIQQDVLPPPQLMGSHSQLLSGPQAISSPQQLLDVIISRVAFSVLMERLDAMRQSPLFCAASVRPKLPRAVTRETAAAVTAGQVDLLDENPCLGTSPNSPLANEENPYDYFFTRLVMDLEMAAKHAAIALFATPGPAGLDPSGAPSALTQLQQMTDPQAVWHLVAQMEGELNELRRRNRAMAEDLLRINPAASIALATHTPGDNRMEAAPQPPPPAPNAPPSQAEIEARVAAELRAAKAEAEAGALRQQVEVLQARLHNLEAEIEMVHQRAAEAAGSASKAETDLTELSTAYNQLETHAFSLEQQNQELERERQSLQQELLEAERKITGVVQSNSGGLNEAEVQLRVEAAVKEESAGAVEALDEQLTDLLVCLGQEEQKNAVFSERLRELGVDVGALLEGLGLAAEGGEEDEDE